MPPRYRMTSPTVTADYGGIDIGAPLRILGEGLMAARERKLRQQQADRQNARQDSYDEMNRTKFDVGMEDEGYERLPDDYTPDPSLPASPLRVGRYQKTGPSQDEYARLESRAAVVDQDRQAQRRAKLFSDGLDEYVASGGKNMVKLLAVDPVKGAQAADDIARAQGWGSHAVKPTTGRWQKEIGPDGSVTYYNPDTNETRKTGRRERASAGSGAGALDDVQREQRAVAGQIDDNRSDLARAEREGAGKMTRPMFFTQAGGEKKFVADSAAAAGKINALKQRSDSLTAVNDRLVGRMGGRRGPAPTTQPVPGAPGSPAKAMPSDLPGYQKAMKAVFRMAEEARKENSPQTEIDAAIATASANLKKKFNIKP